MTFSPAVFALRGSFFLPPKWAADGMEPAEPSLNFILVAALRQLPHHPGGVVALRAVPANDPDWIFPALSISGLVSGRIRSGLMKVSGQNLRGTANSSPRSPNPDSVRYGRRPAGSVLFGRSKPKSGCPPALSRAAPLLPFLKGSLRIKGLGVRPSMGSAEITGGM